MILNGKQIAQQIQEELKEKISLLPGRKPVLAVILVGENPASQIYIKRKMDACAEVGITSVRHILSKTTSEEEVLALVHSLNKDSKIDGILIQLPLPDHVNPFHVMAAISPDKDVDGFHPTNMGKLLIGETDGFFPCTPLGIQELLKRSSIELTGRNVLILGRSNIVGKPLAAMLMQSRSDANATVTVAHSKSKNLPALCRQADILIVAIGQPYFVKADMVKEGAVIVDVGINRIDVKGISKLVGDVDFEGVKGKCSAITPVPGGVGPLTIAMLLQNTLKAYQKCQQLSA